MCHGGNVIRCSWTPCFFTMCLYTGPCMLFLCLHFLYSSFISWERVDQEYSLSPNNNMNWVFTVVYGLLIININKYAHFINIFTCFSLFLYLFNIVWYFSHIAHLALFHFSPKDNHLIIQHGTLSTRNSCQILCIQFLSDHIYKCPGWENNSQDWQLSASWLWLPLPRISYLDGWYTTSPCHIHHWLISPILGWTPLSGSLRPSSPGWWKTLQG